MIEPHGQALLYLGEVRRKSFAARGPCAQRQSINEQPDQAFGIGVIAPGDWRADYDILLPAITTQYDVVDRQQDHVRRRTGRMTESPQSALESMIEAPVHPIAGKTLHRWPRKIG